jgi:Tol biopolymer transport system component
MDTEFQLRFYFSCGQLPCYTSKDTSKANKSSDCISLPVAKPLTEGNFNVGGFSWSPDGKQIAFNRQSDPLINSVYI